MAGWHDHFGALAHAAADGHVCGPEAALRTVAVAVLRQAGDVSDGFVSDVFVTPTETFVVLPAKRRTVRYRNGLELREALDRFLLDGDAEALVGVEVLLEPPD